MTTITSSTFTPRQLIELPRPGAGHPNASSTLALLPSSTFTFDASSSTGRTERSLHLIDLKKPFQQDPPALLSGLAHTDALWIDERTVIFLRPVMGDAVTMEQGRRVDHPKERSDKEQKKVMKEMEEKEGGEGVEVWAIDVVDKGEYHVGTLPVAIANWKLAPTLEIGASVATLTFSAKVFPDGDIYKVASHKKEAEAAARGSDVKVYDALFTRHWDEWKSTAGELTQLQVVQLTKSAGSASFSSDDEFVHVKTPVREAGKWSFVEDKEKRVKVVSPLKGTKLECPVGPFGGPSDYSLSSTHIVFHSKDPQLNPAWHTRTQVYLLPLLEEGIAPKMITKGDQGATNCPTFSDDGNKVAWLEMRKDGYEADKNRVMIYDIASGDLSGVTEDWDRSPSSVYWSPCGTQLFLVAEDEGHVKAFQLSLTPSSGPPKALTNSHSITSLSVLSPASLLLTLSSLTSPNTLSLLTLSTSSLPPRLTPLASLTPDLIQTKSLHPGEEFWFEGSEGARVHGWILFPPGAQTAEERKGRKFPLAFLVHGGPQGAWEDAWSTRWNPNVYAGQGFITVAINPTGSTGYGQKFCDDIQNSWGGRPFEDLIAGLNFVKKEFPEIDGNRMAMLGASYGGYMANWIQGHNDQMGFKAIVCHDGVFSTTSTFYSTDELYFPEREFGGVPWDPKAKASYEKWNPQNFIQNWKTPMLVIHGGQDFRLVDSESLGMFNTLQRLGVASRLVYFPSENHFVLSPANGVRWHEEVFKWITEFTAEKA